MATGAKTTSSNRTAATKRRTRQALHGQTIVTKVTQRPQFLDGEPDRKGPERNKKTKARTTITENAQRAQIPPHTHSKTCYPILKTNAHDATASQNKRGHACQPLVSSCGCKGIGSLMVDSSQGLINNNLFQKSFYSFFFGHTWVHSHGQSRSSVRTPLHESLPRWE